MVILASNLRNCNKEDCEIRCPSNAHRTLDNLSKVRLENLHAELSIKFVCSIHTQAEFPDPNFTQSSNIRTLGHLDVRFLKPWPSRGQISEPLAI